MELKKIGPVSLGRISAWVYGVMGLIFGALFSMITLLGTLTSGTHMGPAGAVGLLFGLGAIIIFPVLYAILGFVGGVISAAIYNMVARYGGGLELEFAPSPANSSQTPIQPVQ